MMSTTRFLSLMVVAAVAAGIPASARAGEGAPVAGFRLQDAQGNWHALPDAGAPKLAVVAFLGTECPLANQYAARLAELARDYAPKGVAFLALDANRQDAPSALARFAKAHDLPFPLLKDVGNEVADRLGASRTPEVFVLDAKRVVRYRGRIDDQYGFGVHRPSPTRRDLASALDDLLAGRSVATPETAAAGCRIGRVREAQGAAKGAVTYAKDVARILRDRCVGCHREGEIAPFSLSSYRQAAGWADMIAEVVEARRMPPWHASPEFGTFANDPRLSDQERRTIADWATAGAPEGDPCDLPPPADYVEGWRIPKPDLVVTLPETVKVPAEGTLPYKNFVVDPKLTRDVWVRASQVRPGNASVVHHLVVFVIPPGSRGMSPNDTDFLAAYAPGMPPRVLPEGLAKFVPAGSRLLLQVHYTPHGLPQADRSEVGLVFAERGEVRKRMSSVMALNTRLRIPAGAADYAVMAEHRFGQDMILYSLLPHMHLRGKSMRIEAVYPDGRVVVLLDVPHYEFEWQNVYVLAEPKRMPEGTVIRCLARYDNSAANPSNPDPNTTVTWGEQTRNEMLVGYLEVALADQDLALPGPSARDLGNGRSEVTFRYRPSTETQAKTNTKTEAVYLTGTFNDWKPTALKLDGPDDSGGFTARVVLEDGTHEYKFVLNGKDYRHDPANRQQAGFYHNSVLTLGTPKPKPKPKP